jgi:hypothetical protein
LITAEQIVGGAYPENIGRPILYTGPRVAGLTPMEMQARTKAGALASGNPFMDMIAQAGGTYDGNVGPSAQAFGMMDTAAPVAVASGQRFKDSDTQAFMNPYMDAVFGEIERTGDRTLNDIRARAAKGGAFGGSRQAVAESLQRDQTQRQVGQAAAQAFESGQQQFNTEQNRGLQISQLLNQLGQSRGNLELAGNQLQLNQFNQNRQNQLAAGMAGTGQGINIVQLLNQLGGQERGIAQGIFDTQYGDFREARDYPMRMQQYIQSVLAGTPFERTTTTAAPGSSALAQLLGGAATVAGAGGPRGFGFWGK